MSFGNEFSSWRSKRQRPGAVLADGSTSVLALDDILGSSVDPDENVARRRLEEVDDSAKFEFYSGRKPSMWSGGYDSPVDLLLAPVRRSIFPGGGLPSGVIKNDPIAAFADDLMTPAGVATSIAGYGLGKGAVNGGGAILGPVLRGAERAGSAAYGASGVDTMLEAENFGELGLGAVEAFLGYLGMRQPGPAKAAAGVDRKLLGAGTPPTDYDIIPGNGGNPWMDGSGARELPGDVDAEPFGSWGRTRQIPEQATGEVVDAGADPLALLAEGTPNGLPAAQGANALYPAALPPHGPVPLDRPPTALERPDLVTDSALLANLRTAMQAGNREHLRVWMTELESRRGALSMDPLQAPVPPTAPSGMTAGAPEAMRKQGTGRRGQVGPQITPEMSDADALAAFLGPYQARMDKMAPRLEPQPIDVPIEQRPIRSRTAPAPEFEPAVVDDPLAELEELVGVRQPMAMSASEEAAERAYQTVLAREVRQEPLRPGGSLSVLDEMDRVREAREAARTAIDVEDGYVGTGRTTGRAQEGPGAGSGAPQHPNAAGGGMDVSGGVSDRAVGGPNRPAAAALEPADEAYLQSLVADARAAGHEPPVDELREYVASARGYLQEQNAIDPDRALLEFIGARGGLNAKAERAGGGMGSELDDLQRNLGGEAVKQGYNKRTGELLKASLDADVRVPGITGPIVTRRTVKTGPNTSFTGLSVDEMTQQLQKAGFKIEPESLMDTVLEAAERVKANPGESLESVMAGLHGYRPGAAWWQKRDEFDDVLDMLDTGESQARLPGAGMARAQEIATPEVADAPFSLSRQADTTPDALESDLFAARPDVPRGTPRLDAVPDVLDEAAEAVAPSTFEQLPGNVRSYLTKRLGWTPEEINALTVDEATAHGRNQVRPDRPEPSPESRKAAEGRALVREQRAVAAENELLSELERFFKIEQPARAAKAAARAAEARTAVPKKLEFGKKFNTGKAIDQQIEVVGENVAARNESAAFKAMSESEQKAHQSRLAGEHRNLEREIEKAWADPNPSPERIEKLAKLYEEQADEFMKGQLRGGTGKELSNDELAKKFTKLYGGIPAADPEMVKALIKSLQTSPAMRAFVGGMAGYQVDDEDGFRGALYGMALAAGAPSGAQALARAARKMKAGQNPWPILKGPSADKDISFLRAYLPFAPERTVPEVFNRVQENIANLQSLWETSYAGDIGHLTRLSEKRMGKEIRAASKAAEEAGQTRKAWYLEKLANSMEGRLTAGQKVIQEIGKGVGVKLKGNEVERHVAGNIYRVLIGWALDSAAKNTTQPMLATLYVSPKSLAKAYKVSRDPRALKLAERFDLNIHNIPELADTGIVGKGGSKAKSIVGKIEDAASAPIRLTDNFNRRVVMLAALEQAGKLDAALAGKLSIKDDAVQKAMSIVRKTQGHTGAMGSHPLYRGPVMGSIKPFTKFPFLFIDNALAALQDPEAKGAQFAATIMGAALVAKMFGIDFEDLFISGGRPLGLDLTHPAKTVRDLGSGRTLPVTRAISDAKSHILDGDADHPVTDDLSTLLFSRYPQKVVKNVGHMLNQGMGEHKTAAGTGAEHSGYDDALGLLGLRTEERGDKIRAREEQYEWLDRTRRKASDESRERREDWREAFEAGDDDALAEIEALMSPQQRRTLRREAEQSPDERMRSRVPVAKRPDYDRRFGGRD
jgi:hypothetical protein